MLLRKIYGVLFKDLFYLIVSCQNCFPSPSIFRFNCKFKVIIFNASDFDIPAATTYNIKYNCAKSENVHVEIVACFLPELRSLLFQTYPMQFTKIINYWDMFEGYGMFSNYFSVKKQFAQRVC